MGSKQGRKNLLRLAFALCLASSVGGLSGCNKHYRPEHFQTISAPSGGSLGATRRSRREARMANWGLHKNQPGGDLFGAAPSLGAAASPLSGGNGGRAGKRAGANPILGPSRGLPSPANPFTNARGQQGPGLGSAPGSALGTPRASGLGGSPGPKRPKAQGNPLLGGNRSNPLRIDDPFSTKRR